MKAAACCACWRAKSRWCWPNSAGCVAKRATLPRRRGGWRRGRPTAQGPHHRRGGGAPARTRSAALRGAMDRVQGVVAKLSAPQEGNTPRTEPLSRLRTLAAARRHPIRIEQEGSGPRPSASGRKPSTVRLAILTTRSRRRSRGSRCGSACAGRRRASPSTSRDHGAGMSPEFIRDQLFQPRPRHGRGNRSNQLQADAVISTAAARQSPCG